LRWTYKKILEHIQKEFPTIQKIHDEENSTAYHYQVPGFKGNVGIIAAFSRTFCGTCNRIRLTAQGTLKTCLYDDGVLNIKDLMRSGVSDLKIKEQLLHAFSHRPKDGFEAEQNRKGHPLLESMSTIGG
jgi:cyclic pyranopterin phosphate synthase